MDISTNGAYIDGVSLTQGNPHKHIWTFIAAKNKIELSLILFLYLSNT